MQHQPQPSQMLRSTWPEPVGPGRHLGDRIRRIETALVCNHPASGDAAVLAGLGAQQYQLGRTAIDPASCCRSPACAGS